MQRIKAYPGIQKNERIWLNIFEVALQNNQSVSFLTREIRVEELQNDRNTTHSGRVASHEKDQIADSVRRRLRRLRPEGRSLSPYHDGILVGDPRQAAGIFKRGKN